MILDITWICLRSRLSGGFPCDDGSVQPRNCRPLLGTVFSFHSLPTEQEIRSEVFFWLPVFWIWKARAWNEKTGCRWLLWLTEPIRQHLFPDKSEQVEHLPVVLAVRDGILRGFPHNNSPILRELETCPQETCIKQGRGDDPGRREADLGLFL